MSHDFKIFGMCVVKNEADIIAHSLTEASQWADRIFVMDNGSEDETWEIVQRMASDVIVPWKRDREPFSDSLRNKIFQQFHSESEPGDWWCRFDADEIYATDPRAFLAKVPLREHVVWGISVEYYLTKEDVDSINFCSPTEEILPQLHCYRVQNSEIRFCRYRVGLNWPARASWPRHVGVVHPRRIPLRHYKYRSPSQIQQRLKTRRQAVEQGCKMYWEHQSASWEDSLADPATCLYSKHGEIEIDEAQLPRHLERPHHRLLKSIMHGSGIWP